MNENEGQPERIICTDSDSFYINNRYTGRKREPLAGNTSQRRRCDNRYRGYALPHERSMIMRKMILILVLIAMVSVTGCETVGKGVTVDYSYEG